LFHCKRSSHCWLSITPKLNRSGPLLHYLSIASSLLRPDPPLLSHAIPTCRLNYSSPDDNNFSCSIQKPVMKSCQLYPGCYAISNQIIHCTLSQALTYLPVFNITLLLTRLQSLVHSIQLYHHAPTGVLAPVFPYRSPPKRVSAPSSIRWFIHCVYFQM
jgi:hypothetical protein